MYFGADFHSYLARGGRNEIHPDDVAYLAKDDSPFKHKILPCPFDGPLDKAKLIICLSNPSDGYTKDVKQLNKLVMEMRSGEESLPHIFDNFYSGIFRQI